VTANRYISAIPGLPLFVDPYMPGTRRNRSYNGVPDRSHRNIHLRGSRVCKSTRTHHQDSQKGQFYDFALHMLVFKLSELDYALR
jgi:hypothetical protein